MNVTLSCIERFASVERFIEEELLTLLYQGRYIKEICGFQNTRYFFVYKDPAIQINFNLYCIDEI